MATAGRGAQAHASWDGHGTSCAGFAGIKWDKWDSSG